ncbi:MAG: glycoside hydrolase family 88 protein, partial [Muribaculaceae bacterium]|nr:glycoside hydrolase family 88 protein [Muribaculaceae bacterium]
GNFLIMLNEINPQPQYVTAIETLREQLRNQPRTDEGGFWHKQVYPEGLILLAFPVEAHANCHVLECERVLVDVHRFKKQVVISLAVPFHHAINATCKLVASHALAID